MAIEPCKLIDRAGERGAYGTTDVEVTRLLYNA
jgi:hypothetical protein